MKVMRVPIGLTILAVLVVIYFQRHDREGVTINNEEDFAGLLKPTEIPGDFPGVGLLRNFLPLYP